MLKSAVGFQLYEQIPITDIKQCAAIYLEVYSNFFSHPILQTLDQQEIVLKFNIKVSIQIRSI